MELGRREIVNDPKENPEDPDDDEVVNEFATYVTKLVDNGTCPRCQGPLVESDDETLPGSSVTDCRCIPICEQCSTHEVLCGFVEWPTSPEQVQRDLAAYRKARPPLDVDEARGRLGRIVLSEDGRSGHIISSRGVTEIGESEPAFDDDAEERRGR